MSGNRGCCVTEMRVKGILLIHGTGPLACLSLFPVAELDKVSE